MKRIKTFLSMDALEGCEAKSIESQAVHLPYAGVAIQNNLNCTDRKEHGLMYYTGGAHYVHAHLSGLDMELYGAGCVMGGVGGSAVGGPKERSSDIFVNYYRNYAAHNTVVVNGKSVGGKKGWKGYNMMWMDTVKLEAMEPRPYTPAASKEFTFSSQILDDTVNKCTQQRIVGIVRTGDESGYYLDVFRSRSNGENKFHDYIYHNIGDGLTLKSPQGDDLGLTAQEGRYQVVEFKGRKGTLKFPGWHCFSEVRSSPAVSGAVFGRFDVKLDGKRYMYVAMPAGVEREYTSAAAPPTFEGAGGYEKKPARVLSIRQNGEAWERPFIVAYEPSANERPTIQSIENIVDGGKVVGAKVVSKVGSAIITDRIIAQDSENAAYKNTDEGIIFNGRFAIIRTLQSEAGNKLQLYIGDGEELSFRGHKLSAGKDKNGYLTLDP